jgi:hypothetical protein
MADVLLSLTMPDDVAEHVKDLLLSRPDLVRGFTASHADGHGSVVPLVAPSELVSGHSPRTQIRAVGSGRSDARRTRHDQGRVAEVPTSFSGWYPSLKWDDYENADCPFTGRSGQRGTGG